MGPEALNSAAARALRALERHGLLLVTDARLPSLVALVAGEPVRGSWWGHPRAQRIYAAAIELEDHPDVAAVKLVSGKMTFVHRRLWPALLAVATARERWQMRGLAASARRLLDRVEEEGVLDTAAVRRAGPEARALAGRLLVRAQSVHTESGAHAIELESWRHWAARVRVSRARNRTAAARALEDALRAIDGERGADRLPWRSRR